MNVCMCVASVECFSGGIIKIRHTDFFSFFLYFSQTVKNLFAMWKTWVQSLGCEDPLEKGRLPTPVFWPGEFHGVAKSRTRLNNFIFTVNRGFRKMMLLQKFEINFYSIISHSFHVIQ